MKPEFRYTAFGMNIKSFLPLALPLAVDVGALKPEASTLAFQPAAAWPVEIVEGVVRSVELPSRVGDISYGRTGKGIQFDIPRVARYSIEGDARIVVERISGAREDFVGLYISGLILAAMLGLRGILALHGSAVVGGADTNGAGGTSGSAYSLVFIGDKGTGKSTTAAALAAHGYRILCDDVIPIASNNVESRSLVLPGIPLPKLLADAYEKLIGDPREAPQLFDGVNKYQVSLPSSDAPAPIRAILALEISAREDQTDICVEPIKGSAKMQRFLQNALSLQGLDDPASIFALCAERLAVVPCWRVLRPAGKTCIDELVDAIIAMDGKGET